MINLTKAEEQIMKHLWKLDRAYMKDIVEEYDNPKPAYTTIATILTRMIEKGYVGFRQQGKVREYFPKLNKQTYFKKHLNLLIKNFFNNSTAQFASFFTVKSNLSLEELEQIKKLIEAEIKEKKK